MKNNKALLKEEIIMDCKFLNNNGIAWRTRPGYPVDHKVYRVSPVKLKKTGIVAKIKDILKMFKLA